jgi:hypothetical protein
MELSMTARHVHTVGRNEQVTWNKGKNKTVGVLN